MTALYRDVEGADGLVGDQEGRVDGERASDRDALALPAGELVREPVERRPARARRDRAARARGRAARSSRRHRATCPRTRSRRPSSADRASRRDPGRRAAPAGGSAAAPAPSHASTSMPVVGARCPRSPGSGAGRAARACSCRSRTRRRARASHPACTSRSTPSTADSQLVGRPEEVPRDREALAEAPDRRAAAQRRAWSSTEPARRASGCSSEALGARRTSRGRGAPRRSAGCGSGSAARSGTAAGARSDRGHGRR